MTSAEAPIVIVGAGQAGGETAAALRMAGYDGDVVLIGDEGHLPYARPPLSKAFLLGKSSADDLYLRPESFYGAQSIRTEMHESVIGIDLDERVATLSSGTTIEYSRLVLATGGQARRLPDPVAEAAPNVHYLRTITDVDELRPGFVAGARLTVVGGGYVGLEVAAVARQLGLEVTVLEAAPRLLARVAGPEVSTFFHRVHTEAGVDIRLGAMVDGFTADDDGRVSSVLITGGRTVPTDIVLIGIGLDPNVDLAVDSGLEVEDGIVVDEFCRTSNASVFAIGDCSRHPDSEHGGMRRLESVPNATEQARVVASVITGAPKAYTSVPWFWSDQYELKLQSVGLSMGHDEVVLRGSPDDGRRLVVFYLKDGEIRAADVIASPRDFVIAKKLVAARARIAPSRLGDPAVDLKELVADLKTLS